MIKVLRGLCLLYLCLFQAWMAEAAPTFNTSATWTAAQAGRTWMDIGGVWNGTTEVTATTGDTVSFVLNNSAIAGNDAFDLTTSVALAAGFNYVANSASVTPTGAGCGAVVPTVTALQTGTTLNFTLTPAGYDLPAQCSLTFQYGLTAASSVVAGTFQMNHQWDYGLTNGGALTGTPGSQLLNILVYAGATIISKLPGNQLLPVSATAAWTVSIRNSGLGGLFDVSVDEYTINPSTSLALTSIAVTAPLAPTAITASASKRVLPYLAPGVSFDSTVQATVTSCRDINNNAYTTDRTGTTADVGTAQVTLNMELPLVNFSVGNYSIPYTGTTPVSITINNTGQGAAANFTLQSELHTLPINVTNVAAGWSYNSGTGLFTYTAGTPAGTIANAASVVLTFDIAAANVCTFSAASNIHWTAKYTDVCSNAYVVPIVLSNIGAATGSPGIALTKTSADSRLVVDTYSSFSLGFSATNTTLINGTAFSVTDTLPSGISAITVTPPAGTSYSCPGGAVCNPGDVLTWNVPKSALPLGANMLIGYKAPADACVGGSVLTNSASVAATSIAGCGLSASASAGPLMTNNPGATVTQLFDVGLPIAGAAFETGLADNGNTVRDVTEGEFIPFTATYIYDGTYPGAWSGSTYVDNFGGLPSGGATLISGTLAVRVDNGGALAVPNGNVTCTTGSVAANTCAGSFTIDLGFLAGVGYFNDPYVAAHQLNIDYATTASDANLGGGSASNFTQLVTLTINGGGAGGCGVGTPTYTQGAFVAIARAAAGVALSIPSIIDVCQPLSVTMTASNGSEEVPNNLLATLLTTGNYEYPTGQTPTYGGLFTTGNITYAENGGANPTFGLTPTTTSLTSNGTLSFSARLKAGSSTTPAPLQGTLAYDDWQTAGGARDFSANGQSTPALIRQGQLVITVTPQLYTVIDSYAEWKVYVTNVSSGTAYATELIDRLPTGVTLDTAGTDAANAAQSCAPLANCNVSFVDPYVTWNLGDIPAGSTRMMTLKASLTGATCAIPDGSNQVTARWGCGGVFHEVVVKNEPNFIFPAGQMQVVHDTTGTSAPLCGTGKDVIIVRNTGKPHVINAVVSEAMNPGTSGLDIVPGTVEFSTDGGTTWAATGNPTGLGTTASPYQWDETIIAALADLAPVTGGGISEVRIRFSITAGEAANTAPTIHATATGSISCGDVVNSPGTPYAIPVNKPNFTISKSGINRTATGGAIGTGTYVNQVFGGVGDKVEWKIDVANNGDYSGFNVRLNDKFAGSAGTMQIVQAPTGFATPAAVTDNTPMTILDVPATTTHSYIIEETLGNTCVGWTGNANTVDVTWGCVDNGATVRSNLSTPTTNTATANLVMLPGFSDFSALASTQNITYLSGGRAQVDVNFVNGGGTAQNVVLTSTAFPANMRIDPYASPQAVVTGSAVTPTCTAAPCLDGTVVVTGTETAPIFTLGGTGMRNGAQGVLTFYLLPTLFDDQYATTYTALYSREPNTASGTLDPRATDIRGNHTMTLDTQSTCAQAINLGNTKYIDPLIPDLDMTPNPNRYLAKAGNTRNYDFNFRNYGDTGSVADNITVSFPQIGAGFTINSVDVLTPADGGAGGACAFIVDRYSCTPAQIGTYTVGTTSNANRTIRVNATINDNAFPLNMLAEIKGEIVAADGTTVVGNYSLDHNRPMVLGVGVAKTLLSTSETFTTGNDVAIGEELNYQINARLFGGDPAFAGANTISGITVRDTLPVGMGLVSVSASPYNTVTVNSITGAGTPAGAQPLNTGVVDFNVADITTGEGTFEYYMTTRVLNIPTNTDNNATASQIGNNLGAQLTYLGQKFRSNNAADGFSGGVADADLHAAHTPRIRRPTVTIKKEVRNFTTGSAFGPESGVNGGDTYEYRITLTTTGTQVAAYDLSLVDTLPAKLILIDSAGDGIDNDGDGTPDDGTEGTFTPGAGGTILFNDANTAIPTAGASFAQLNRNNSITLLYRAKGDLNAIVGGDILVNTATATYTSLPGVTSGMSAPLGVSGDTYGELSEQVSASAPITMARVSGWVYLDGNQNIVHDGFEGGTTLTLYAKIIDTATGLVVEVQPVNPTTGVFAFGTAAAGNYTVIIDDNNIMTDTVPNIPAGWIGTEAPTQIRSFTLGTGGSATSINFGLYNGQTTYFNGTVFEDNGLGGGVANTAIQDGTEVGIPSVVVTLTDCYSTVYSTANTDGLGNFSLPFFNTGGTIPDGTILCINETNPTNYISTGGSPGNTGGSYDRTADRQVVSLVNQSTSTGITFADVAPNKLLTDGQQMALPGTTVVFPHTFVAGTGGTVTFSTAAVPSPAIPGWSEVLYQDNNCDLALDAGDTQITAPIALAAQGSICLLLKEFVPLNAPFDARTLATLTASFDYTGATPALPVLTYIRNDLTIVGQQGLVLKKSVDKTTALPGDIITYTIIYSNPTSGALTNLVIHDTTPAYTTFVSAACDSIPAGLTCTTTDPGVGVNGSVQWQITGTVTPNSSGTVSYSVQLTP